MVRGKINKEKEFVKACPNCGSINASLPNLKSLIYRKGSVIQPIVDTGLSRCNDCNYHGIFVEVRRDRLDEFRKKLKKSKNKGDRLLFG